jgi:hypothetical protein
MKTIKYFLDLPSYYDRAQLLNVDRKTKVFRVTKDIFWIDHYASPGEVDLAFRKDDILIIFYHNHQIQQWALATPNHKARLWGLHSRCVLTNAESIIEVDFEECLKYPDHLHHQVIEHFTLIGVKCDKYFKKTNRRWMANQWESLK